MNTSTIGSRNVASFFAAFIGGMNTTLALPLGTPKWLTVVEALGHSTVAKFLGKPLHVSQS